MYFAFLQCQFFFWFLPHICHLEWSCASEITEAVHLLHFSSTHHDLDKWGRGLLSCSLPVFSWLSSSYSYSTVLILIHLLYPWFLGDLLHNIIICKPRENEIKTWNSLNRENKNMTEHAWTKNKTAHRILICLKYYISVLPKNLMPSDQCFPGKKGMKYKGCISDTCSWWFLWNFDQESPPVPSLISEEKRFRMVGFILVACYLWNCS